MSWFANIAGCRTKITIAAGLAVGFVAVGLLSSSAAEDAYVPPLFDASYERPFGAERIRTKGVNVVSFRVWKGDKGGGDVLSGHLHGSTLDCRSNEVHFCIHQGYMTFAVPRRDMRGSQWSWKFGKDVFNLVSRQTIYFRGKRIEAMTIRGVDTTFRSEASFYVYNYDIGLIAFANYSAEDVDPKSDQLPDILTQTSVLGSEHGLGGRENCKYWTCGK